MSHTVCDNYKNLLMREAAQKKPCRVPKVDPELRLGILASADMRVDKEWSKIDLRDKDKKLLFYRLIVSDLLSSSLVLRIFGVMLQWPRGTEEDELYCTSKDARSHSACLFLFCQPSLNSGSEPQVQGDRNNRKRNQEAFYDIADRHFFCCQPFEKYFEI